MLLMLILINILFCIISVLTLKSKGWMKMGTLLFQQGLLKIQTINFGVWTQNPSFRKVPMSVISMVPTKARHRIALNNGNIKENNSTN